MAGFVAVVRLIRTLSRLGVWRSVLTEASSLPGWPMRCNKQLSDP